MGQDLEVRSVGQQKYIRKKDISTRIGGNEINSTLPDELGAENIIGRINQFGFTAVLTIELKIISSAMDAMSFKDIVKSDQSLKRMHYLRSGN